MTTETAPQEFTPEAPVAQHEWLQQLVGEWTSDGEGMTGTETVTAMGDLWIVGRGRYDGGTGQSQVTLGFDPKRDRFVGTWVGTMGSYQWVYDGKLDGNTLTLACEGPAFDGSGRMQNYRDVHEVIDEKNRTLKAYVEEADGSWRHFMTTTYTRKA